jgi:AraC-like DNA-binding protein
MFEQIAVTFIFIVAGLSLIISIGQLFVSTRRIENYNLVALFLCMGVLLFHYGFISNGAMYGYPALLFPHLTLTALLGPLIYYAFFFVGMPEKKLSGIKLFFLLPSALMLVPDLIYMIKPFEEKIAIVNLLFFNTALSDDLIVRILFLFIGVQSSAYYIFLLVELITTRHSIKNRRLLDIAIVYIINSIILDIILIIGYMSGSLVLLKLFSALLCVTIIAAFIISNRDPGFLHLVNFKTVKDRYKRSRLDSINADTISAKLSELMEQEKVFTDEDITLKRLAYDLSITPHQLSQFLNQRLNTNFNAYINKYRVEEAKKMLIEEPDRSILSVADGVGFNSKSSFYRAFAQATGKTPHKFRKDMLSSFNS